MQYRNLLTLLTICLILNVTSGCASFGGYPANPTNSDADIATLTAYSGPQELAVYLQETDPQKRRIIRDQFVYARLAAYDIEFQNFQENLNKEANLENVSGDFAVLVLNGVGATSGGAATKAALAAASAGVVGATAHINKDIFYNQALPALLAQMSASRTAELIVIQRGLQGDDNKYPLPNAILDLNSYREAGSLPSAINTITTNAGAAKAEMKSAQLQQLSTSPTQDHSLKPARVLQPVNGPAVGSTSFFRNLP